MPPTWIEIDLAALRNNYQLINADIAANAPGLRFGAVLKDNAYGHGAVEVAREAAAAGAAFIALIAVAEAIELRSAGITTPILLMGERQPSEFAACVELDIMPVISDVESAALFAKAAQKMGKPARSHIKLNTGMSRFGLRWTVAPKVIAEINRIPDLNLAGLMSHFAMSDEKDKTFARQQLQRYREVLDGVTRAGVEIPMRHFCNSGGFLDLPEAHFDLVRIGILQFGVFPSQSCRRLTGIKPVMTVKSRISAIQHLEPGDSVGYGMRYTAARPRRIGVVPIGYGDGFPRVRNEGELLVRGKRAPIVGGVSMDAITVDITDVPDATRWDEVVIMGTQGSEEISVHDLARLKKSVSYDVLVSWRDRVPRIYKS